MGSFAKRLKQLREQAGFTQEQLAESIGVTRQAVSRWEQGHTQPDMEMLVVLSEALQVDAEVLAFGRNAKPYQRFQKKHLISLVTAFSLVFVVFLLMTFLDPYLKNLVNRYDIDNFVYFWIFKILLPPIGCFALGFSAAAFIALFYNTCLIRRWKIAVFILGLIAIAPSLFVIVDYALGIWIPGHSIHITFALYMRTVSLPAVHALLFRLLPTLSGALMFLGLQNKQ